MPFDTGVPVPGPGTGTFRHFGDPHLLDQDSMVGIRFIPYRLVRDGTHLYCSMEPYHPTTLCTLVVGTVLTRPLSVMCGVVDHR